VILIKVKVGSSRRQLVFLICNNWTRKNFNIPVGILFRPYTHDHHVMLHYFFGGNNASNF
jgi:hypothetical protein